MSRIKTSEGKQEQDVCRVRDLYPPPTIQELEDWVKESQAEREYYNARNAAYLAGELDQFEFNNK